MFKGASHFKTYMGSMAVLFVSLALVGCAKKISPVAGSEGIAGKEQSSASASSPQGGSRPSGSTQEGVGPGMGSDGRSQDMAASGESGSRDPSAPSSGNQGITSRDQSAAPRDGMASLEDSSKSVQGMSESEPKLAENVYFDFDKWTIRGDARDMLTENARWLVANSEVKIQIEGHGDERGTNEYNLALGERRARSTKRYLINLGVSPSRISFISYGEEKNVCGEKNEECFQKNRRAHFVVK